MANNFGKLKYKWYPRFGELTRNEKTGAKKLYKF
jgi:hypothetical protein